MTENEIKTIRERIDDARALCAKGDYKGALKLIGELLLDHEGATASEIKEISTLRKYLSENIAESGKKRERDE